ncbi:MAG: maleylpyruvate isomerase N-terminal domain-containing protein [Chitinophagaceae bacterium]
MQPPINVLSLFPVLDNHLLTFLRNLSAEDWQKQTVAKKWVVKDVAAHMLDTRIRQISIRRDNWAPPPNVPIRNNEELVDYLNTLNADWVKAAKRLSPALLIELLQGAGQIGNILLGELDPFGPAIYSVSWAGETFSYNWFDIAREYTEYWHHQQQIRDAVGNRDILTKELYHPVLDIFLYAWPFAASSISAPEGTVLKTTITGNGGGEWFLKRASDEWLLSAENNSKIAAETIIDGDVAWTLFSKSVRKEDIPGKFEIKGDQQLGNIVLDMISVMA